MCAGAEPPQSGRHFPCPKIRLIGEGFTLDSPFLQGKSHEPTNLGGTRGRLLSGLQDESVTKL